MPISDTEKYYNLDIIAILINYLKHDGSVPMTGDLDLGTHKAINVVDPVDNQDADTKVARNTAILAGLAAYVQKAGDTMSGDLILENDIELQGKDARGDASNLIKMTSGDAVEIGSTYNIEIVPFTRFLANVQFEDVLNMTSHKIYNVLDPVDAQDADTKAARNAAILAGLAAYVQKAGDTMSGTLDMDGNSILDVNGLGMSGNINMVGNKVNLDTDGNSFIWSSADNIIDFILDGNISTPILRLQLTKALLSEDLDMEGNNIIDVATPLNSTDASNKAYSDLRQLLSEKDAANGYAGLDGSTKINPAQLPSIAITDTFVVASQAAMLALTAQTGDIAIRTDLPDTYILRGTDPSVLGDWEILLHPTDVVTSIFGRNGVVTAQNGDYTASQVTNVPAGAVAAVTVQAAIDELDTEKEPTFSKNTAFNKDFGSGSGDVCEGDDARLSDARTPLGHKASHQDGGGDEISVAALSGQCADGQYSKIVQDSSEGESTTTSGTYDQLKTLSITVALKKYLVHWFYEYGNTNKDKYVQSRIQIADITTLTEINNEAKDKDDWFMSNGGVYFWDNTGGSAGAKAFDLDALTEGGTAKCRKFRIILEEVKE